MADEQIEQGELTERFRAFSESVDPEPSRVMPVALIVAAGVGVVVIAALVWFMASR